MPYPRRSIRTCSQILMTPKTMNIIISPIINKSFVLDFICLIIRHLPSTLGQKIQSVFACCQKLAARWRDVHDAQFAVTWFGVRHHFAKAEGASDGDFSLKLYVLYDFFHGFP